MLILDEFGFRRARIFVLEHLTGIHFATADPRWVIAALILRSFGAIWVLGQAGWILLIGNLYRRRKVGHPEPIATADTTVAAVHG